MKRYLNKPVTSALLFAAFMTAIPLFIAYASSGNDPISHVLLLSIDGLHEQDLARYVQLNPNSALAELTHLGITYTKVSGSKPSNSFPGLLSMVTGGSPRTTGVFYDDSYDRSMFPPGSNCQGPSGAEILYDETLDFDSNLVFSGGINPANLPKAIISGQCVAVYPHRFLRVNTIFEVAHQAGLVTAWSDDHPAYDIVRGRSGSGLSALYVPEFDSIGFGETFNHSVDTAIQYDQLKVNAILDEISGTVPANTEGSISGVVPAIFGMNFQAVNVGQQVAGDGYLDAAGAPSLELQKALDNTDQSIGAIVAALRKQQIFENTVVIITAKHGQTPIDPTKRLIVDRTIIPNLVNSVQAGLLALATQDDVSLLWLNDQSKVNAVVAKLNDNKALAHIDSILSGNSLTHLFNDPTKDSRTPDIIVLPQPGVIYANPTSTKIAEHGGFNEDDTHVALLIANANPHLNNKTLPARVHTEQIAPTILRLLNLDPNKLQAVGIENTQLLPALFEN
jgi:predicted AlkP superfamily pyrophosphatase or phosphodiesterase